MKNQKPEKAGLAYFASFFGFSLWCILPPFDSSLRQSLLPPNLSPTDCAKDPEKTSYADDKAAGPRFGMLEVPSRSTCPIYWCGRTGFNAAKELTPRLARFDRIDLDTGGIVVDAVLPEKFGQ
jgi:hypothetical protein